MASRICLTQLTSTSSYLNQVFAGQTLEIIRRGRLAARVIPESVFRGVIPDAHVSISRLRANAAPYFDRVAKGEIIGVVRGGRDDFDVPLWSEAMREEHIDEYSMAPGLYRVLYVNDDRYINDHRWSAWPTSPGAADAARRRASGGRGPWWARLSFCENGSMTSGDNEAGLDQLGLGLSLPVPLSPTSSQIQASMAATPRCPPVAARRHSRRRCRGCSSTGCWRRAV